VRSPPPEEEKAAEATCDELTATSIPHSPALHGGRRKRKSAEKLSQGRREGWGEGVFSICFYFLITLL